jgi:hypothetical protein
LQNTTGGSGNIGVGPYTLLNNTSGDDNYAMGNSALEYNTTGNTNIAIGSFAGIGDGSTLNQRSVVDNYAILIGSAASRDQSISSTTVLSNIIAIGKNARVARSNSIVLGGTSSDAVNVGIGTTSPNYTLTIRGTAGTDPLMIASSTGAALLSMGQNGRLGIGTSTPSAKLTIVADAGLPAFLISSSTVTGASSTLFMVTSAGKVTIGTSTPSSTSTVQLTVNGNIRVGMNNGNVGCIQGYAGSTLTGTCTSDQNLKTNISDVSDMASRFAQLRVINYNWNQTAGDLYGNDLSAVQTGYLAQNVETLFPELVTTNDEGYKQVNYSAIGVYTAKAVGELSVISSSTQVSLTNLFTTASSTNTALLGLSVFASTTDSSINSLFTVSSTTQASVNNLFTIASSTDSQVQSLGAFASSTQATLTSLAASLSTTNATLAQITSVIDTTTGLTGTMRIDGEGNIGIGTGTSTLGAKLEIYNATSSSGVDLIRLFSDVGGVKNTKFRITSDGDIFTDGSLTIGGPADFAENYTAMEALDAGTVVAFSTSTSEWSARKGSDVNEAQADDVYEISGVRKAIDGYEAVGVVSTKAALTIGSDVKDGVPVAFKGRIPVKVTTENGEVKRGDYLTVSNTMPGYAMKLTGEGKSLGRALSDYIPGREKIMILVENGYQKLSAEGTYAASTTNMLTVGNIGLDANGVAIVNIKSLASANGTWSIDENGRIVAKVLCLEDVCIDKSVLTKILDASGGQQVPAFVGPTLPSEVSTTTSTSTEGQLTSGTSTSPGEVLGVSTTTVSTTEEASSTEVIPTLPPVTTTVPESTSTVPGGGDTSGQVGVVGDTGTTTPAL